MTALDLSTAIREPAPGASGAPICGAGYVKGWGVSGLPFDSGHVLALRVFPESDTGAYRSLWHRDPAGDWRMYVHDAHVNSACARYFGAGARSVDFADIDVEWVGPASVRVRVDTPKLDWTFTASTTPLLRMINSLSERMPMWTWRPSAMIRARELMARGLGMGDMRLSGITPSGHHVVQMPRRMYYVDESTAVLDGEDLGRPAHVAVNPTMRFTTFPARGVFAIGQAAWQSAPRSRT